MRVASLCVRGRERGGVLMCVGCAAEWSVNVPRTSLVSPGCSSCSFWLFGIAVSENAGYAQFCDTMGGGSFDN